MSCELLCSIDPAALIAWIDTIPPEAWPARAGTSIRGPEWQNAAAATAADLKKLLELFPGSTVGLQYFSYLAPGTEIATHVDAEQRGRTHRLHVPIKTGPGATLEYADTAYHLEVGKVYSVNPLIPHSVHNRSAVPRIHWIFDVHQS